jgi:hypothetical protein
MTHYCVDLQPNELGDHLVHAAGCSNWPKAPVLLCLHSHCSKAVEEARDSFERVKGCPLCCPACHGKASHLLRNM